MVVRLYLSIDLSISLYICALPYASVCGALILVACVCVVVFVWYMHLVVIVVEGILCSYEHMHALTRRHLVLILLDASGGSTRGSRRWAVAQDATAHVVLAQGKLPQEL